MVGNILLTVTLLPYLMHEDLNLEHKNSGIFVAGYFLMEGLSTQAHSKLDVILPPLHLKASFRICMGDIRRGQEGKPSVQGLFGAFCQCSSSPL